MKLQCGNTVVWRCACRSFLALFVLVATPLFATEFRSPFPLEKGPMRFLFGEEDESHGMRVWTAGFNRTADRAFSYEHGTTTEPLPALFFNSADFRITEAFPECLVSLLSEYYNPLLRTAKLHLRAKYTEQGVTIGFSWDYPFYHENGRIGVRANLPIKRVSLNKIDMEGVRSGAELQDVMSVQPVSNTAQGGSQLDKETTQQSIMVRLDFAEALTQASDRTSAVRYNIDNRIKIGASNVDNVAWAGDAEELNNVSWVAETGVSEAARKIPVLAVYSPEGLIPRNPDAEIVLRTDAGATAAKPFPEDGNISSGDVYFFDINKDYKLLADEHAQVDLDRRLDNQVAKSQVWLIPIQRTDNYVPAVHNGGTMRVLEDLSRAATESVYEWLYDRGTAFETYTKEGIGDLDVEGFYEHMFNDNLVAEFSIGVRIPTAKKVDYIVDEVNTTSEYRASVRSTPGNDRSTTNPYRTALGNNGHWEVKGGGMVAWQPTKSFGVKGEAYYSMVLEADEERSASFKNALIKNIGPKAIAAVDWGYFVARADVNVSHPRTTDITAVLGYEFLYKREENVRFTKTKMSTWLGKMYDSTTGEFDETTYNLSNTLSAEHTDGIAHRLRAEASFVLSDWSECFFGACWTCAGKNMPRELDMHFGFNVAF